MHEGRAKKFDEDGLPPLDNVDDRRGLGGCVGTHAVFGRVLRHSERNDGHGRQRPILVGNVGERLIENVSVIDAGTHDHLAVHLNAGVKKCRQPPQ